MSHHFHWLLSMFQPISHPVTLINSWDRDRMKLHPTKSAASQRRFWQFVDSLEAGASTTSNDNYVRHQKPFLCAWCAFAVTPPKQPNRKRDNSSMESVTWWWQLFCTATSESQQSPPPPPVRTQSDVGKRALSDLTTNEKTFVTSKEADWPVSGDTDA